MDGLGNCTCIPGGCPLGLGRYTLTSTGGTTQIGPSPPNPRVVGERTILEVGPPDANCVHPVVVPYIGPGNPNNGYTIPITCLASIVTVQGSQAACGNGWLDSDGGSDFTLRETGDTSSPSCGLSQPGCAPGANLSIRRDIRVGDGVPDTCTAGLGQVLVSVPIGTLGWIDGDGVLNCPDEDGTYDLGQDILVSTQTPTVNFTTDTANTFWAELPGDNDSCFLAGFGPAAGYGDVGVCINYAAGTISWAAAQPLGGNDPSTGNDASFTSLAIQTFVPSGASTGATCPVLLPGSNLILGGTRTWCLP